MQIDLSLGFLVAVLGLLPVAATWAMVLACKRKLSRMARGVLATLSIVTWPGVFVVYVGAWPAATGDLQIFLLLLGLLYIILGGTQLVWMARWHTELPDRVPMPVVE